MQNAETVLSVPVGTPDDTTPTQDTDLVPGLPPAHPHPLIGEPGAVKAARRVRREATRKRTQPGTSPRGRPYLRTRTSSARSG
jgi:hypothetical protein